MEEKVRAQLHQDHEFERSRHRMCYGSSEEMYPIRSCGILAGRLPGGSETEKASESEPLKGLGDGYG